MLQYQDDKLDESNEIQELLQAAAAIIPMKRPMVQINVEQHNLSGAGHAVPLLAPPSLEIPQRFVGTRHGKGATRVQSSL